MLASSLHPLAAGPRQCSRRRGAARCMASSAADAQTQESQRRAVLFGGLATVASIPLICDRASAVQGMEAGRLPGLSAAKDGLRKYLRPEGKSGGHGIGWSEIPQYGFNVPEGFEEIPTSIADLGGAELDLRLKSDEGDIAVVVAPVLRFADVGFGASVKIEELVTPAQFITGFAPELAGQALEAEDLISTSVVKRGGLTYYEFELKPKHLLVSATAVKNRVFILTVSSSSLQWRKAKDKLKAITPSFFVNTA